MGHVVMCDNEAMAMKLDRLVTHCMMFGILLSIASSAMAEEAVPVSCPSAPVCGCQDGTVDPSTRAPALAGGLQSGVPQETVTEALGVEAQSPKPPALFSDAQGHIGIGTNSPSAELDVSGEVMVRGISGDGAGKVVCVKSDGTLGTCSTAASGSGSCDCN
jgi:hypothetical protein